MKIVIAAAALALAAGSSVASAQTANSSPEVKAGTAVHGTATTPRQHRRHHYTTGIGPENNASAPGSLLPGKDRLNSKAYIQDH
jgi:hypothetical protein